MDIKAMSRKEIGALGERIVCLYLQRKGFVLVGRNYMRKTGEIDVIARKADTLHFVEVKTILCREFPITNTADIYDPSANLHETKIRKVARTSEWYVAENGWSGEWEVDGALVWIRERDAMARVSYLPQLL